MKRSNDQKHKRHFGRNVSFPLLALSILVNAALLVVAAPPAILYEPKDQPVVLYQQAAFGVIASGTGPLFYQWRKDGGPIPGGTNDQIVLAQSRFADAGQYSVIVSNAEGSVTSTNAVLNVRAPQAGDMDCSFNCGGELNGAVHSLAVQRNGKVLIAGGFGMVRGAIRGGVARLNADGTTDYTFMHGLSGAYPVKAVLLEHDGKIVIAGGFGRVNEVNRKNLARLNPDGSLDGTFQNGLADFAGDVLCAAQQGDGKVLVGGFESRWPDRPIPRLIRVNTDGTRDNQFQTTLGGADGSIWTVAIHHDDRILIGGSFSSVNGVQRTNVARLNPDGTLDMEFRAAVGNVTDFHTTPVRTLTLQSDGKVIVAGQFRTVNGVDRSFLARLNEDGSLDGTFLQGLADPNSDVWAVSAESDGKILIGGEFSEFNGVLHGGLVRLHRTGELDSSFQNGISANPVSVKAIVTQNNGQLLIGGEWFGSDNTDHNIARLRSDGSLDSSFHNGRVFPAEVTSAIVWSDLNSALQRDGRILVGGDRLERFNADESPDTTFQSPILTPESGFFPPTIRGVRVQADGKILIVGEFASVNGVPRNDVARLNADGTLDNSFKGLSNVSHIRGSGTVSSLALQPDGRIIIGGTFTTINNAGHTNLARLRADGTLDDSFNGEFDNSYGWVTAIALQNDGKVVVGGYWISADQGVMRFHADGTQDKTFSENHWFDYGVSAVLIQSDGKVLATGGFTKVNGLIRHNLARLNADGTLDTSFESAAGGGSIALQPDGMVLIAGSIFNGVARLWGSADIPARIISIDRNGGDLNLLWDALPDRRYRVQYTDCLATGVWTDLPGEVLGSRLGSGIKADGSIGGTKQRFYRVALLP